MSNQNSDSDLFGGAPAPTPSPEFLASHGRYGIPFNIISSDEVPNGLVLSELLQTSSVMAALETAGISSK